MSHQMPAFGSAKHSVDRVPPRPCQVKSVPQCVEAHSANFVCYNPRSPSQISTASVDRAFSAMKHIRSDWRAKLDVNILSKLMCISNEDPELEEYPT